MLELAPSGAEVLYWQACLQQDPKLIERANAAPTQLVLPFRGETADMLRWAIRNNSAWQPKYYLALIYWSRNDLDRARKLLAQCGKDPDDAGFYAVRAALIDTSAGDDLGESVRLDPGQWHYAALLANHCLRKKQYGRAVEMVQDHAKRQPENVRIQVLYAKALLWSGKLRECSDLLDRVNLLPCEGDIEGRNLFREVKLALALQQMKAGRCDQALTLIDTAGNGPRTWRGSRMPKTSMSVLKTG